jgi:hypothetical protein
MKNVAASVRDRLAKQARSSGVPLTALIGPCCRGLAAGALQRRKRRAAQRWQTFPRHNKRPITKRPVGRAKFLSKRNLDTAHISPVKYAG